MKNTSSKIFLAAAAFALPLLSAAQQAATTAAPAVDLNYWEKTFGIMTLIGASIAIFAAIWVLTRVVSVLLKAEEMRYRVEKGMPAVVQEAPAVQQEDWWKRFLRSATKTVPVAQEADVMLDHNYDGIRELDNRLPPWWLWLFYASIIFAPVYWYTYHLSDKGKSPIEEYEQEVKTAKSAVAAYVATQAKSVDESTVAALTDEREISLGESTFKANCVVCHGNAGEGNSVGPNLSDDQWLHGCGIQNVFKTVKYGVVDKGMQSWSSQLRPIDIQRVASYILTLKGSNPPNAKAPQGTPCDGAAVDSTSVQK